MAALRVPDLGRVGQVRTFRNEAKIACKQTLDRYLNVKFGDSEMIGAHWVSTCQTWRQSWKPRGLLNHRG
jgi:hypothetical protein